MTALSELEGVVLGMVDSLQPCTAYAVRRRIVSSPSTRWSASAGAIYPLLARLEEAGMVTSRADTGDRRGRRLVTLTREGKKALRRWVLRAGDPEVAADVADALRTRVFFLSSLSPSERRRFVDRAIESAEAFRTAALEYARSLEPGDPFREVGAAAGVYAAEARLRWLRELSGTLDSGAS